MRTIGQIHIGALLKVRREFGPRRRPGKIHRALPRAFAGPAAQHGHGQRERFDQRKNVAAAATHVDRRFHLRRTGQHEPVVIARGIGIGQHAPVAVIAQHILLPAGERHAPGKAREHLVRVPPVIAPSRGGVIFHARHTAVHRVGGVRLGRHHYRVDEHETGEARRMPGRGLHDAMTTHGMPRGNDLPQIERDDEGSHIAAEHFPRVGRNLVAAAVTARFQRDDVPGQMTRALIPNPPVKARGVDQQGGRLARPSFAPLEIGQSHSVDVDSPCARIGHVCSVTS